MAGHHKWDNLMRRMSPARRARIERGVRRELEQMLLAELRKQSGMTQVQLAKKLGIKQPGLSKLESQDDMQIGTLRRIVEALGGELDIVATLPRGRISLSQFKRGKSVRKGANRAA
jgi:transcriptional regulator with XRE-family HTH domain